MFSIHSCISEDLIILLISLIITDLSVSWLGLLVSIFEYIIEKSFSETRHYDDKKDYAFI